eukprot:bmy_08023T0
MRRELTCQWPAVLLEELRRSSQSCNLWNEDGKRKRAQHACQEPGTLSILCHPGQCGHFHCLGPQIRGLNFPSICHQLTSPCFLVYKLDQKISNALQALRSHDLDKPTRGVSSQASFPFLPLWLQNLGFGNCLDLFFSSCNCVCACV